MRLSFSVIFEHCHHCDIPVGSAQPTRHSHTGELPYCNRHLIAAPYNAAHESNDDSPKITNDPDELSNSDMDSKPKFAVVVTTIGRPELLDHLLASIHTQTLRPSEVVVVDQSSDDGTRTVV